MASDCCFRVKCYYPMKIIYIDKNEIVIVHSHRDVQQGRTFRVLEANTMINSAKVITK